MRYVILTSLVIYLLSCPCLSVAQNAAGKRTTKVGLQLVDSVALPLADHTEVYSYTCKYFTSSNNELIYWRNGKGGTVDVFDLEQKKLIRTLTFPMDGSLGFDEIIGGFTVLGIDTLLLATGILGKMHLFYGELNDVRTVEFASGSDAPLNNLISLNSRISTDAFYYANNLIVPLRQPGFRGVPSKEEVEKATLFMAVDTATLRATPNTRLKLEYHLMAHEEPLDQSMTTTYGDKLYYQFGSDHHLYASEDLVTVKKNLIHPEQAGDFISWFMKNDFDRLGALNTFYFALHFDPINELVFRFLKLPVGDIQTADIHFERDRIFERVLITIVDPDLQPVGEHLFENSRYSWDECFIGKKGLYLLRSAYHPEYSEEHLTFDIWGISPEHE